MVACAVNTSARSLIRWYDFSSKTHTHADSGRSHPEKSSETKNGLNSSKTAASPNSSPSETQSRSVVSRRLHRNYTGTLNVTFNTKSTHTLWSEVLVNVRIPAVPACCQVRNDVCVWLYSALEQKYFFHIHKNTLKNNSPLKVTTALLKKKALNCLKFK